ncbi:hypothetical protein FAI40_08540 [Acetobacteraceae bacterium]|nr:hypothetical protein FAI40_08540 [Acetobacteraceae bacterium]
MRQAKDNLVQNASKDGIKKCLLLIEHRDFLNDDDESFKFAPEDKQIENIKEFFMEIPFRTLISFPDFILDDLEKCSVLLRQKADKEYRLEWLGKTDYQEKSDILEEISLLNEDVKQPYLRLKDWYEGLIKGGESVSS